jgi:putative transposase
VRPPGIFLLVPKLHLGTRLSPKLRFAKLAPVRSRYHINEACAAHFVTATIVAWLPVFTTAERCDILIRSLEYCRAHKDLRIHAWVILDNHFHAILAAPDLSGVLADLKRHTARRVLELLKTERCEWLLNQFRYFRAAHKAESTHQIWQEGSHPEAIVSDEIMLQKLEYLHNNPVKRGLVAVPEHWRYSSAHEWCPGVTPLLRCDAWR